MSDLFPRKKLFVRMGEVKNWSSEKLPTIILVTSYAPRTALW